MENERISEALDKEKIFGYFENIFLYKSRVSDYPTGSTS